MAGIIDGTENTLPISLEFSHFLFLVDQSCQYHNTKTMRIKFDQIASFFIIITYTLAGIYKSCVFDYFTNIES